MGAQGITKAVLAEKMQVSRSAITQLLSELRNNNFTLDTLLGLSGAVGLQCAIVLYQTPNEDGAPVYAEIFARCWERVGKPKDFWELNDGDIK
jgi:transcriptional regulator with XRE-family HTH domain